MRQIAGFLLLLSAAWAQNAPEFEVAHIALSKPGAKTNAGFLPGGRVELRGATLKDMIAWAWNLDDEMISGGPKWLDADRFDIVAKAGHNATGKELDLMLQALLKERFHLRMRLEDKIVPAYALTTGKQGPKLKPATGGDSDCKMRIIEGIRTYRCQNMTMADFADRIRAAAKAYLDHPVIDLTGLKGAYDFTVAWTGSGKLLGNAGGDQPAGGQTVFEAVTKQLGLELTPRKLPLPSAVIDSVERTPTEN